MKLEQQIVEVEALVTEGETASYLMPHVLDSLYRLRQISAPTPPPDAPHLDYNAIYTNAVELYDRWHKQTVGVRMRFTAAQGKSMKQILKYLTSECGGDAQAALNSWQYILESWGVLNTFLSSQTDLTQINKHLIEIIAKIKAHAKGRTGNTAGKGADVHAAIDKLYPD